MTKNDMVLAIAERTGVEQITVRDIVQQTLDGVVDVLATERRLELRNFGVFEVRPVKSHKARNPRTGAQVLVPDRHRVVFKAGRVMRRRLRESTTK